MVSDIWLMSKTDRRQDFPGSEIQSSGNPETLQGCRGAGLLSAGTGSFALNAGIAGAKHVTGVDASELGIEQARENARLNGLEDRVEFVCADVFDLLPKLEEEGKQYDVVILDPPAFTKSP